MVESVKKTSPTNQSRKILLAVKETATIRKKHRLQPPRPNSPFGSPQDFQPRNLPRGWISKLAFPFLTPEKLGKLGQKGLKPTRLESFFFFPPCFQEINFSLTFWSKNVAKRFGDGFSCPRLNFLEEICHTSSRSFGTNKSV